MNDRWRLNRIALLFVASWLLAPGATAEAARVDFERQVWPILQRACVGCHGPVKQKAGLRLDLRAAAMKGGESGAAIVPGKADQSLIVRLVRGEDADRVMPAKGDRLTAAEVTLLRGWIAEGAQWPETVGTREADKRDWWSLRPIKPIAVPEVKDGKWGRNAIDRFVLARLEGAGSRANPEADRRALIRRVTFDLIGLPPTPGEVRAFVEDRSPGAYERVVDRLLASPRFGERWARHWLDVVRYADSQGFEMNQPRPNAWPYRDWVIRAFNEDLPYDRFIIEQLAGDQLKDQGDSAATGFLVAGPWDEVKSPDPVLTAQQRADELHDIVSVTGAAFLGLTVGCARCHDHKFDPIAQTDYYRMAAVFAGVQHGERAIRPAKGDPDVERELAATREKIEAIKGRLTKFSVAGRRESGHAIRPAVVAGVNEERFGAVEARVIRFTIDATNNGIEPCIDELEIYAEDGRNVALVSAGAIARASGTFPGAAIHKLEHINDGRYGNSHSWISNERGQGWVEIELPRVERINRVVWGRDREGKFADRVPVSYVIAVAEQRGGVWRTVASSADRAAFGTEYFARTAAEKAELDRLLAERKSLEAKAAALVEGAKVYAGRFAQPGATHRLNRGDPMAPREAVSPGGIAALGDVPGLKPLELPADAPEGRRRLALARWLTDPANPLVARVIVNRLWQNHFGQGLVTTPSDFGHMGGRPSHPELLDYLGGELVKGGWRLKAIHRLMVTSAAYRQSAAVRDEAMAKDAGDVLLWRYAPRRLEGEALRDAMLAVSGKLDLRMGGPGFELFKPNANYVHVYEPKEEFGPAEFRRMIYAQRPRMQQDAVFGAFDCPDAGQAQPRRPVSTTPLQALNLLNSPFVLQQAGFWAERLRRETGEDPAMQARRAFEEAFGRPAEMEELSAAVELIRSQGLAAFCRAMLNANEFVYVH
jgi:mono/diheme cytochrome c family protein